MSGLHVSAPVPVDEPPPGAAAGFAAVDLAEQSLEQVVQHVADLAADHLADVEQVSVSLFRPRSVTTGFAGDLDAVLDERQYAPGFGPSRAAALQRAVVRVDGASPGAFAEFADLARRRGVRTTVAVGLPMPGALSAALCLYAAGEHRLPGDVVGRAVTFARYAATCLTNAVALAAATEHGEQLETAMASRARIEQAKGVVVAMSGCTPEEAFSRLSRTSQESNRKLRDVAGDVVARAVHRPAGPVPPGSPGPPVRPGALRRP